MPSDIDRLEVRVTKLEDCVADVRTAQAVVVSRLDAISDRSEERHAAQLAALGEVRTGLLEELRAGREHQQALAVADASRAAQWTQVLRDPRVLLLLALAVVAIAAPQAVPALVSMAAGTEAPVAPEALGHAGAPGEAPAPGPVLDAL